MSAFNELKDMAPLQIWPGLIARALTGAEATLAQIELEPEIDVPEHSHANE
jgi:quercetin dioxygenase-like cupin family protein